MVVEVIIGLVVWGTGIGNRNRWSQDNDLNLTFNIEKCMVD